MGHVVFLNNSSYKPFVIAIYCGKEKPHDVNLFLSEFVQEVNSIRESGINICDKKFNLKSMMFICDIPARIYFKQVKGHTGFFSCERCNIPGYTLKHRTIFPCYAFSLFRRHEKIVDSLLATRLFDKIIKIEVGPVFTNNNESFTPST